jgi:hypothetical protein
MSVTRATVRAAAKQLIQDALPNSGTGAQFLLNDPSDYNAGIAQALRLFDADVPNKRVAHVTMTAVVFRLALAGPGAILPPQKVPLPVASLIGAGGAKVRSYRVAARNAAGQGLWSDAVRVATGPATLDGTHKIRLDWAARPGATSYDVFGRDEGQELLLANQAGTSFLDDGTATPSSALETTGLDAWVIDGSSLDAVWLPYSAGTSPTLASQGQTPLDDNEWLVRPEPGPLVLLELTNISTGIGQVLRLEFTTPHVLDENSAAYSSIPFTKIEALQTLTAAVMLRMVANRYLQNSGSTGLPSDIVDRRSQSDQAASRAKDYLALYRDMVGGGDSATTAASGFADLDVLTSHNRGSLWHPTNIR